MQVKPKGEYFLAGCHGKDKLDLEVAQLLVRKSRHKGLGYYRCKWCGSYHVGSNPTRQMRDKKSRRRRRR